MYCSSAINFDDASVIIFFTSTCIWFVRKVIWFFTLLEHKHRLLHAVSFATCGN
jgi:hypothetical protein